MTFGSISEYKEKFVDNILIYQISIWKNWLFRNVIYINFIDVVKGARNRFIKNQNSIEIYLLY